MQTREEAELDSCRRFSDFYKLIFVLSIQASKSVHANVIKKFILIDFEENISS